VGSGYPSTRTGLNGTAGPSGYLRICECRSRRFWVDCRQDQKVVPASHMRSAGITGMDPETAARCWADTGSRAWPQRDVEAIAALYAETAVYRSPAFRQADVGLAGVRHYLNENLQAEDEYRVLVRRSDRVGRPGRGRMVGQLDRARPGTHIRGSDGAALRRPGARWSSTATTTTTSSGTNRPTRTGEALSGMTTQL
jgi:hypothetical protein